MRLMEILTEVALLEDTDSRHSSFDLAYHSGGALLEGAQKRMKGNIKKAAKVANQLKARKGSISWSNEDNVAVRNKIINSFLTNDYKTIIKLFNTAESFRAIEIFNSLETAHGGRDKLIKKAGKSKLFMTKIYNFIDELEGEEA